MIPKANQRQLDINVQSIIPAPGLGNPAAVAQLVSHPQTRLLKYPQWKHRIPSDSLPIKAYNHQRNRTPPKEG
jgi:hypothetical protein